jgi:hypothetical protein
MRRTISRAAAVAAFAGCLLVVQFAPANAGTLTLHPSGFGPHSYASWKAYEGQPDTRGSKDQALYMQKNTVTTTVAAGVVLIKGVEGLPASQLTGLAFDHREDTHCGAGAPRWNVGISVGGGPTQNVFFGCNAALHDDTPPESSGADWCRDTQPSPATVLPPNATIEYLAIIFDEGIDTANPPPAGCDQELPGQTGRVYLDNITVEIAGVPHTWTSATDNGSGGTTTQNTPLTTEQLEAELGFPAVELLG